MKRKTFCVTFFLRRARTSKKGLAPILARITTNGISKEIYIQCSVDPQKWDQAKERTIGRDSYSQQVNTYLDEYRTRILQIRQDLEKKGHDATAIAIKDRLLTGTGSSRMFLAELAQHVKKRQDEVGKLITQKTADKYHRLLRYNQEYIKGAYKRDDILLTMVDYAYISGFYTFMQTAHECHHNGAVNLLRCLKHFILYALRSEWIEKNPFKNFSLVEKYDPSKKKYLTKEEFERIYNKEMPNKRLEQIKDIFVFCCFTGLAFTDILHLRAEHIIVRDHITWITKPREKTSVTSLIPLLPIPLMLLSKYEHSNLENGLLLPVPSCQRMNSYLKEIATICNIDENLTTHVARHTFATLAVEYGMPIDVLAKILGHSNVNMTRRYAKFSSKVIKREMEKLSRNLSFDTSGLNKVQTGF